MFKDEGWWLTGGVGRNFCVLKQILVTTSKSCEIFLQIETIFLFVSSCQDVETQFDNFEKM